ncbi:MAG: Na+/H+ antiporter NhaA [Clostridiales Family XIII bacterium]|jgi:NhaA family Na+:H+ antiporter|nr:Na+/H+ antiporter NhaA [Clostridiales Family XIII bacterium]
METNVHTPSIINNIREYSVPLLVGVIASIIWKNLSPVTYDAFVFTPIFGEHIDLYFIINDVFMVFFFATAGIEIVYSLLPGGALFPVKKAVMPLMATAGGVLGPTIVFFALNSAFGAPEFSRGWGICTATDIALSWLLARLVFGKSHPAVNFLLLLAVADDGIGMGIIAIFYPDPAMPAEYEWLLLILAGMGTAILLKKFHVHNWVAYIFAAGALSWTGLYKAHLHPALALIFIVPFIPHSVISDKAAIVNDVPDIHGDDIRVTDQSPIAKCENRLSSFVDFGLVFFGLTNAGVALSGISTLTWIVCVSLIVGKTGGILLFSRIATLMSFKPPGGMNFRDVGVVGLIAGAGLTVALFVAGAAFTEPDLQSSAKMGALFSSAVFIIAPLIGRASRIKKISESVQ